MRIFLSAVSTEFKSCRDALASDLRAVGAEVKVQEDFQQQGGTLLEKLESYIAGCDRVIALIGNAYGWEPPHEALPPDSPRRSYTQWEYFFAQGERLDGKRDRGKDVFVYLASPDFLELNQYSQSKQVAKLQQKFIAHIRTSGKDHSVFHSLDELRALVLRDGFQLGDHKSAPQHLSFYAERIQNFLDEYLGTPTSAVPFGGRENELATLDNWLKDSKTPYAVVAAEAGRGKSALLVRWMRSLQERNLARVIFIPISIRFNTALSSVTFPVLAAGLSEIFGEPVGRSDLSVEQWRNVCLAYMRRTPPEGNPLLVILDGLDEASDWHPGPDLFPASPPSGLRILVSARYLAGDVDERGWLRRLGWEAASLALSIPLPPLSRRGVSHVLAAMGDPLSQLATQVDVVGEVFRLSQGDPLLVRLYVKALLPYGENAASLRPTDLPSIREGLEGYFERWWDEQTRRAETLGRPALTDKAEVLDFFNVCATALGPLSRKDLEGIVGGSFASGLRLRDIARAVDRFVIGDGVVRGYVFGHPRLAQFFWEHMSQSDQAKWKDRFLEYGRNTLDSLDKGQINPSDASHYIIQYYGAHLEQADAPAKDLYALVTGGWLRAWEAVEGTYAGFLNDTERAWRRAESALPPIAGEDITALIKCVLCRSSIVALSANVPAELLALCVQHKVLTPLQALTIASQTTNESQRSAALARLAPTLPPDLMGEALAVVRAIKEEQSRAVALVALVPYLTPDLKAEAMKEALAAIREIKYEDDQATVLTSLAPDLPESLQPEALAIATGIDDEEQKALTLIGLVPSIQGPIKAKVEQLALDAARRIEYEQSRIDALIALASVLREDLKTEVVQEALAQSQNLPKSNFFTSPRADALAKLALHLTETLSVEALAAARAAGEKEAQVHALIDLVPYLPDVSKASVVQEALDGLQAIKSNEAQAKALIGLALIGLAPYLPDEIKPRLMREALEAVLTITDVERRPMALRSLAPHLPEQLLSDALAVARAEDDWARLGILIGIAPRLSEKYLKEALELAQAMKDVSYRVAAVAGLSAYLPEPLRRQALQQELTAVRGLKDEREEEALIALAPHLPEDLLGDALEVAHSNGTTALLIELIGLAPHLADGVKAEATKQALSAMRTIHDEVEKVRVLVALAPYLPPTGKMLLEVLAAARTTGDEKERVHNLIRLAAYLPNDLKTQVLIEGLALTQELPEWDYFTGTRAAAIVNLAPLLPEALKMNALEMARALKDKEAQAAALTGLARYPPEGLNAKVVQEALEAARAIGSEQQKAFALTRLVSLLAKRQRTEVVDEAIEAARRSTYPITLAWVIEQLAPFMSKKLLRKLLNTTVPKLDSELMSEVLTSFAPHLNGELLIQAQALTELIENDNYRAAAIAGLAPYLPDTEAIQEALEGVLRIKYGSLRAVALVNLAPYLSDGLKEMALQAALKSTPAIHEKNLREDALNALSPLLPEWAHDHPGSAYSVFKEILREFSALRRPTLFHYLQTLLPFALALAGDDQQEKAAIGVFLAIQDVGSWWP